MKRIKIILSSLIAVPALLIPGVVHAATTTPTTTTTTTTTNTTTTTETIAQRVSKYKLALKAQPTAAEQAKIKVNCKAAQVKGRVLSTQITQKVTIRSAVYVSVTKKVDDLITDLKAANVDTAKLETQRDELKQLVKTYGNDLKTYQENIADMNAVDCLTDPTAFKAALESARSSQAVVLKDITAIRTYINDTLKPTLKDINANNATNGSAQ